MATTCMMHTTKLHKYQAVSTYCVAYCVACTCRYMYIYYYTVSILHIHVCRYYMYYNYNQLQYILVQYQ